MNNEIIATMSYIIVERVIEAFEQKQKQTYYQIKLYANRIETASQSFPLETVFDLSYKSFSGKYWILYLHTNQGVFPFQTDSDPTHFLAQYKKS